MLSKRRLYIYSSLLVCLFIVIIVWVTQIVKGQTPLIDQWISEYVHALDESYLIYNVAFTLTKLGSGFFLIPFTITFGIILLLLYRSVLPSVIFMSGTYSTYLINMYIKSVILRERPRIFIEANAEGYSFPSGHSMIPIVCYGLLMYFLSKKFIYKSWFSSLIFICLIFTLGMSRVILNVHYLTDVITGFFIGLLLLIGWINIYNFIKRTR